MTYWHKLILLIFAIGIVFLTKDSIDVDKVLGISKTNAETANVLETTPTNNPTETPSPTNKPTKTSITTTKTIHPSTNTSPTITSAPKSIQKSINRSGIDDDEDGKEEIHELEEEREED